MNRYSVFLVLSFLISLLITACIPGKGIYTIYERDNFQDEQILSFHDKSFFFVNTHFDTIVYSPDRILTEQITVRQNQKSYLSHIYFSDTLSSWISAEFNDGGYSIRDEPWEEYELVQYNLYTYTYTCSHSDMPIFSINEPSFYRSYIPRSNKSVTNTLGMGFMISDFRFGDFVFHPMLFFNRKDSSSFFGGYAAPQFVMDKDSSMSITPYAFKLIPKGPTGILEAVYVDQEGICAFYFRKELWRRINE